MGDLASIQNVLQDLLRRPATLTEDAACASASSEIASGNDRLSPVEQVDIYREQFFLRHVDCLREDFRSIQRLLGDDAFDELARAYLAAHPPLSFTLRDLGHAMDDFVARTAPWSEDPFIAELARVEWAFVDAFDAPDHPPFDPASLASVPEEAWPSVRLVLAPSVQRRALSHPAHDYRIAARKDETPERPSPRPCHVVVYRGSELLHCRDVEPDAYAMLEELARGVALGEACERAAKTSGVELEAFQAKLGGWFQTWTSLGWISRIDLPG